MSKDDPYEHAGTPTQRLPRYPKQPDATVRGTWVPGGPVNPPMPVPYADEVWVPMPPRRRRAVPKRRGLIQTSTAVTFALLAFAVGFLGGVALVAAVVLERQ